MLNVLRKRNTVFGARNLFEGVLNKIFNSSDVERRHKLGPDRVCAEWLLRNGASVKFKGHLEYLNDYNGLPDENTEARLNISEVKAEESSISHYGFDHFNGCKFISKLIFVKCFQLENNAMKKLDCLKNSLSYLEINSCPDVTDVGLISLGNLNLNSLILRNLPYVKDRENVLSVLKSKLPNCNIQLD